ncbi:MAG: putative hydrophobic protein (TIGR00271 family) [Oceanicoccus sp.]|jgi:uncharacterized hydrophobic protein (TIGR00271 family)
MFKFFENHFKLHQERKVFTDSIQRLIEESSLTGSFFLLTIISAAIATLGIAMNSSSILIGSMLIAPLLIPVISLSVGVGAGSIRLILSSLQSLSIGLILSVVVAYFMARAILPIELDETLYQNFSDSFLYAIVALFSGILAVYSWFTPKTDMIIPGVGIAVALVPPLAFLGVVLATHETKFFIDILQLIFVNLTGIFLGGFITFLIMSLFSKQSNIERGTQVEEQIDKTKK